ncbi:hypothetical protein NE398_10975 [Clostridium tertium]|uniref:Uncharacterized protein n=1 Tax=Clostridium tertium TaxID=1559 RepID=A0A9X4B1F2_9CLOT|nr:hypothetical protein [Clostridium tertium]MDC4240682.1 hypothetical protein [Clostridium tertium]
METNKKKNNLIIPSTKVKDKKPNKLIPTSKVNSKVLIFSFKYFMCLSMKNKEFNNCFSSIYDYATWITFFIDRISNFSQMTLNEIACSGKTTRFHPVENGHLIKLKSILLKMGINVDQLFQQQEDESFYELSFGTGNGRMFGYLIDNQYYILLIDPNHLVYMNCEKGGKHDLLHKHYDPWNELLRNNKLVCNDELRR